MESKMKNKDLCITCDFKMQLIPSLWVENCGVFV